MGGGNHCLSQWKTVMFGTRITFLMSTVGNSTNIFWQECPVGRAERQKLLNQKGCVLWITGLSGSGLLSKLSS
ncbi:Adenylyl-sulfate kinase 3 [Vitis vinifera]|uniref:Adenylyl-sulfate kinase 3 n=1 Tax=Vitis vinifera TaxID=29760 RepID=A0A438JLA1_VITVI|nr:Adenylyl-sulfate kinase 3 [Vitis vinifera]